MTNNIIAACQRVWINARLAAFDPDLTEPYGSLENYAIGVRDGKIAAIAPMSDVNKGLQPQPIAVNMPGATAGLPSSAGSAANLPGATAGLPSSAGSTAEQANRGSRLFGSVQTPGGTEIIDARGAWITPGLIDCHTHLVYGGNRSREIEQRRLGATYEEIARRGGGILSTVRATRAMSESQLLDASLPRLHALADEGATTVEIKSGYGLTLNDELKMLRVARRLAELVPVNVRTTLLAAHALPPEFAGRPDDYIRMVCEEIIPAAADEGLSDAVDVFCERIAFSPAQCERVFESARRRGLPVKGHVEQLSDFGGARLAARFNALSVDHLEYLAPDDVRTLAASGTTAVLLPGAFYFLRETQKPPVERLRTAGVPMAVASDLNPGTSPLCSLRLAINMAGTLFGLTPEEALAGATRAAARALGLADSVGILAVGKQADFLLWDIDHPSELACEFGVPRLRQRVFRGE